MGLRRLTDIGDRGGAPQHANVLDRPADFRSRWRDDTDRLPLLRTFEGAQGIGCILQRADDDQPAPARRERAMLAEGAPASARGAQQDQRDQRLQQQDGSWKVRDAQHQHDRRREQSAEHDASTQLPQLRQSDIAPHLTVHAGHAQPRRIAGEAPWDGQQCHPGEFRRDVEIEAQPEGAPTRQQNQRQVDPKQQQCVSRELHAPPLPARAHGAIGR